jgi:general stress protein YciG
MVYCCTCRTTGKKYVGQTRRTLATRWRAHVRSASNPRCITALAHAIRKHGAADFTREVLEEVAGQAEANAAEIRWIAQLECLAPGGYNLNPGGGVGPMSAESRRKMREAWANRTPEARAAIHAAKSAGFAAIPPERLSAAARERDARMPPEQLAARNAAFIAARPSTTPDECRSLLVKARAALDAMPPEQRSQIQRDAVSPERRREIARKTWGRKTPAEQAANLAAMQAAAAVKITTEQHREYGRRAAAVTHATRTHEESCEIGRKGGRVIWGRMTKEERRATASKMGRAAWAKFSPEERSAIIRARYQKRLANAAAAKETAA